MILNYLNNKEVMKEQFNTALGNLTDKLASWFKAIIENLPNFVLALVVVFLAYFIAKYVSRIVKKLVAKQVQQQSITNTIARIATVVVVGAGLFMALGILNLGKVLTSLLAGAGVVGLAIGLALQGTLSNTFAGVVLSFREKVQIGNWVETTGFSGEVIDINLKNFTLKEADNNIVLIPNKTILDNPMKNYSLTPTIRVSLECGVGYESNLEDVEKLTKDAIANNFEGINSADDVEFFFTEFGDSSINYLCRFWIDGMKKKDVLEAKTKAMIAIKKVYDNKNINIPFPIRTLQFGNKLNLNSLDQENSKTDNENMS